MSDKFRQRRFTLFDAMALLAATAFGLAGTRAYLVHVQSYYDHLGFADLSAEAKTLSATPLLLALSLVLPFVGLWPSSGTPFRRSARQPGIAALLAVAFCFGVELIATLHGPITKVPGWYWSYLFAVLVSGLAKTAGIAVGAVWFAMLLGRRWPSRPDWVELTARFLGGAWIALYLATRFR